MAGGGESLGHILEESQLTFAQARATRHSSSYTAPLLCPQSRRFKTERPSGKKVHIGSLEQRKDLMLKQSKRSTALAIRIMHACRERHKHKRVKRCNQVYHERHLPLSARMDLASERDWRAFLESSSFPAPFSDIARVAGNCRRIVSLFNRQRDITPDRLIHTAFASLR